MRPVSARWLSTIRGSHRPVFEARVVQPTVTIIGGIPNLGPVVTGTDPDGPVIPIMGGDVQWDTQSDILATAQIEVDASYWPKDSADLLAPYGNELFLRRGIEYGNGATEWVSLGYYRINSVEQSDARGGPLIVSASDRMWRIVKNPEAQASFLATLTYGQVVQQLVDTASIVGATIEWDDPAVRDTPTGRYITSDESRWKVIDDLISSLSKIWYWDYRGILVIRDPPSATAPVWTADAGASGVLVGMGRSISDEGLVNQVTVIGDLADSGAPILPIATQFVGDVTSPLWTGSKFGVVGKIVKNTDIKAGQATPYAKTLLAQAIGLPYSVDFSTVPNAALEPWDPITVRLKTGVEVTHVIRRLTIPLSAARPLTGETREYVAP